MTITTLDGALAGMKPPVFIAKVATPTLVAGRPHSLWYLAGTPGAGSAPSASTSGGVALSSTSAQVGGQLYHTDPAGGLSAYLARFAATATQAGMLLLCDRLLHCGAVTGGSGISLSTTTAQAINTATLPARDANGTTLGAGVYVGLEISTQSGAGTPTITMTYMDESGNSGTANNVDAIVATSAVGAFYRMGLAAGDWGVRQVSNLTISATMTSGAVAVVLYRILAALEIPGPLMPNALDALTGGFPQLYNGVVPFMIFIPNTTTASMINGTYSETQG